jgi:hypothetical protein
MFPIRTELKFQDTPLILGLSDGLRFIRIQVQKVYGIRLALFAPVGQKGNGSAIR